MTTLARIGSTSGAARGPRTPRGAAFLLPLLLTLLGCGGSTEDAPRLELYTWWREGSEVRALDKVLARYREIGGEVDGSSPDRSADEVRALLTARMLAGAPPSTFHANVGADLLRWAVVDVTGPSGEPLPNQRRIRGLSGFFRDHRLEHDLPEELMNGLRVGEDHEPFAVPINIHRLNVLYYNQSRLQQFAERHGGRTFLEPELLCPDDLEQRLLDPTYQPDFVIAIGTDVAFPLTLLVFENLLPALGGPDLYDELFRGRPPPGWEVPLSLVLRCTQYLSRGFSEGFAARTWDEAALQVTDSGDADFTVMGDWANGTLASALDSRAVVAVPFPGSKESFVFTADTFPLPFDAPNRDEILKLLGVIASKEVQLDFSREKRSLPARLNVDAQDLEDLGEYAVSAHADFTSLDVRRVLATSGLLPTYYPGSALEDRLNAVIAPGAGQKEIDDALDFIRTTAPLLQRWQQRLLDGPSPERAR